MFVCLYVHKNRSRSHYSTLVRADNSLFALLSLRTKRTLPLSLLCLDTLPPPLPFPPPFLCNSHLLHRYDHVKRKTNQNEKLYYIRFDGTGVCVESCPTETNWSALWACVDDDAEYTVGEGFNCDVDTAQTCPTKADVSTTVESGGAFNGGGEGTCMFQIESVECKLISSWGLSLFLSRHARAGHPFFIRRVLV